MTKLLFLLIIAALLFIWYRKRQSAKVFTDFLKPQTAFVESTETDTPVGFGYKNLWFAVRTTTSKEEIADMLDLKILGKSNWQNGIKQAYDNRIFITPQVNGWTLIVGEGFLPLIDKDGADADICNQLSAKFGEAQYFYTHRITEFHIWAKSINGNLIRYYSYLGEEGENLRIEGEPTEIERGLNLINTFSEEAKNPEYFEDEILVFPDESLVMEIAGNWSIDPTIPEEQKDVKPELGLVCELK